MNGSFDPDDVNIPNKLRNRFLSWGTNIPRLQSSQYGPIDKYLNLKFPNAMVKPQGLMRKILSESNLQAIDSGVVLDNDPEQMINEDDSEPKDVDTSITSIDSYGQPVWSRPKRYPDFIVASYYESETVKDKIRIVFEIGSLYDTSKPASNHVKNKIQEQLWNYMVLVDEKRWDKDILGVAILGIEFCYIHPSQGGRFTTSGFSKWHNLYDGVFVEQIDWMVKVCNADTNV